jgi:hypothetical protein
MEALTMRPKLITLLSISILAMMLVPLTSAHPQRKYMDDRDYAEREDINQTYELAPGARVELRLHDLVVLTEEPPALGVPNECYLGARIPRHLGRNLSRECSLGLRMAILDAKLRVHGTPLRGERGEGSERRKEDGRERSRPRRFVSDRTKE